MTHSGRIRVDQPSDAAIATEGGDKAQEPVEGEAEGEVEDGDGDGDGDGDEHGAGGGYKYIFNTCDTGYSDYFLQMMGMMKMGDTKLLLVVTCFTFYIQCTIC